MIPVVVLAVVLAVLIWPGRAAPGRAVPSLLGRRRRGGAPPTVTSEDAAALAELLAMALRSGGARQRAVEVVRPDAPASTHDLMDALYAELASGRGGGRTWEQWAREHPTLDPCASAWRLSDECGVALAPALDQAARSAWARVAAAQRLKAASAGARATMVLLTALPGIGLLAAWALGVSPARILADSPAASMSVALGVVLTAVGWAVSRWILARAVRAGES